MANSLLKSAMLVSVSMSYGIVSSMSRDHIARVACILWTWTDKLSIFLDQAYVHVCHPGQLYYYEVITNINHAKVYLSLLEVGNNTWILNIRMLVVLVKQETANPLAPVLENKETHDNHCDIFSGMFVQGSKCSPCGIWFPLLQNPGSAHATTYRVHLH